MSGSETLLAPEPIEVQTATAMPEDAAYTYQRADGTVERAMNAEDAIARCPVLGKLAIEAPDQASILLDLAAAGKAKMQAEEQQQKPVPKDKEKIEPKTEPKPETIKLTKPEPEQVKTQDPLHETSIKRLVVEPQSEAIQQAVQAEKLSPLVVSKPVEKETVAQKHTEPAATEYQDTVAELKNASISIDIEKEQHVQQLLSEVYQQYTPSGDEIPVESRTVHPSEQVVVEHFAAEPIVAKPDVVIQTFERAIDIVKAKVADTFGLDETTPVDERIADEVLLPVTETIQTAVFAELEQPATTKIETDELLELRFEPDVIETYEELLALIEGEATEPEQPDIASDSLIEPDGAPHIFIAETIEPDNITAVSITETVGVVVAEPEQNFEAVVILQTETEDVVPLETIIEQMTDEQALEKTLVQLAQYLAGTLQESQILDTDNEEASNGIAPEQSQQLIELRAILQDIAGVLPHSYYEDTETGEQRIKITPEITEQLLLLLSRLGYQHPREVLVEFVRLHGLAYLLQALRYMCQLNDADERKEVFVAATTTTPSSDNRSVGSLLGNAVLRLLSVKTFASEF